jgi:hypothetical protein
MAEVEAGAGLLDDPDDLLGKRRLRVGESASPPDR